MKNQLRKLAFYIARSFIPELSVLKEDNCWETIRGRCINSSINNYSRLYKPYHIIDSRLDAYSYISRNAHIYGVCIGKFCSIGPNFLAGNGLHPTNGISTSPMFYSATNKSNGVSICETTKFNEHKSIYIGNDVFIGANVVVLDGVSIGNGAVVGAGAVVTKDVPAYAIVTGVPAKILKYRFKPDQIEALEKIEWWNFDSEKLHDIETHFYDIDAFIAKYKK